nr:CDP-alcohol phosphatidyltransferase family protein [Streptomyces sp. DSM 41633]
MQRAAVAGDAAALLAAVPAGRRVALVDPRFVGHLHALRLALTDPRFPAATVTGALTAQPEARGALLRALHRTTAAVGAGAPVVDPDTDPAPEDRTGPGRIAVALEAEGVAVQRPALGSLVAAVPTGPEQEAAAVAGLTS